ncbi:MAG: molybdopterin-dependent oxidoreductase [Actinomycetota bacterium]
MTTITVDGACHHDCPDSCGWTATVDTSGPAPVAVKLRGNPDHPFSQGELCPKVNRFLDRVYSPDRLLHPLRRVGPKGSGEFEPVSWDDALAEIADRLGGVIAEHGASAILPYSDAGNQSLLSMFAAGGRLWSHLGTTQVTGSVCGLTAAAGSASTNGSGAGLEATDMVHSKLIVIWGTNTRLTNRHLWPFIEEARAAGARIVVIDPIRTLTAEAVDPGRGDLFIQPRPGTDVAMMLAMMHVVVRDGLVDEEWVREHTVGFDELANAVADWTPARAADECDVDADVIEVLARDVATTQPTAFRTLIGAEHHEHGAMFFRTLACIPALTGAWRHLGGGFSRSVGYWTEGQIEWDALSLPGPGPRRQVNMNRLGEVLDGSHLGVALDPAIHALVVWNVNPVVTIPNADLIRRGLLRDDLFTVVHEQFMTDTARLADLVLPATTQLEADDVVFPWGHLWVAYNRAAIEPQGESCSNTELFRRIAAALDLDEPALFADDETLLREAMPTIDLDELRRERWLETPLYPADRLPFGAPAERIRLASDELEADGQPRVPAYTPASESLGRLDHRDGNTFQLLTPKQHTRFLNSGYAHLPKHGPMEGGPYLELHPDDAARLGLADGATARVSNGRASLELRVKVSGRLRPDVAAIPFGWWRHDHPDGGVANSLTNDALADWGGGVAYFDTVVDIHPA